MPIVADVKFIFKLIKKINLFVIDKYLNPRASAEIFTGGIKVYIIHTYINIYIMLG